MKRSVKQARRTALTADQVRTRELRKRFEAERALFINLGGVRAWEAELNRRRAERNKRTRAHTREVMARKHAAEQLELLWGAA